jgi:hypothetical protein
MKRGAFGHLFFYLLLPDYPVGNYLIALAATRFFQKGKWYKGKQSCSINKIIKSIRNLNPDRV